MLVLIYLLVGSTMWYTLVCGLVPRPLPLQHWEWPGDEAIMETIDSIVSINIRSGAGLVCLSAESD